VFLGRHPAINLLDIRVRELIIAGLPRGRIQLGLGTARSWICTIMLGIILFACSGPSQAEGKTLFLGFKQGEKSDSVPEGWELITYFRTVKNRMSLYKEEKRTVLEVKSLGSASAILKRPEVDLKAFPILVWRWKINRAVGMANESQKDRNDSAARIRVIFGKRAAKPPQRSPDILKFFKSLGFQIGGAEPRGPKIDYIWGNATPKGEVIDYPGSKNHKMVIVQSGNEMANRWVWEKRNLIEDFRQFFGGTPPGLAGIAVLTDTNQTNEGVIASYSSIIMMNE